MPVLAMLPGVIIQPLAVGRAARAINGLAGYPHAGEGARSTPLYLDSAIFWGQNPRLIIGRIAEEVAHALRLKACFVD